LFILYGTYPPIFSETPSYDGEILHADAYRPRAKHYWVLCLKGSSLPKMHFKTKYMHVGQQSQWWRVGRLAGRGQGLCY